MSIFSSPSIRLSYPIRWLGVWFRSFFFFNFCSFWHPKWGTQVSRPIQKNNPVSLLLCMRMMYKLESKWPPREFHLDRKQIDLPLGIFEYCLFWSIAILGCIRQGMSDNQIKILIFNESSSLVFSPSLKSWWSISTVPITNNAWHGILWVKNRFT